MHILNNKEQQIYKARQFGGFH